MEPCSHISIMTQAYCLPIIPSPTACPGCNCVILTQRFNGHLASEVSLIIFQSVFQSHVMQLIIWPFYPKWFFITFAQPVIKSVIYWCFINTFDSKSMLCLHISNACPHSVSHGELVICFSWRGIVKWNGNITTSNFRLSEWISARNRPVNTHFDCVFLKRFSEAKNVCHVHRRFPF